MAEHIKPVWTALLQMQAENLRAWSLQVVAALGCDEARVLIKGPGRWTRLEKAV